MKDQSISTKRTLRRALIILVAISLLIVAAVVVLFIRGDLTSISFDYSLEIYPTNG